METVGAVVQGRGVSSSFYGNGGNSGPRKGRLVAVSMETVGAVVQRREVSSSFYGNGGSGCTSIQNTYHLDP